MHFTNIRNKKIVKRNLQILFLGNHYFLADRNKIQEKVPYTKWRYSADIRVFSYLINLYSLVIEHNLPAEQWGEGGMSVCLCVLWWCSCCWVSQRLREWKWKVSWGFSSGKDWFQTYVNSFFNSKVQSSFRSHTPLPKFCSKLMQLFDEPEVEWTKNLPPFSATAAKSHIDLICESNSSLRVRSFRDSFCLSGLRHGSWP